MGEGGAGDDEMRGAKLLCPSSWAADVFVGDQKWSQILKTSPQREVVRSSACAGAIHPLLFGSFAQHTPMADISRVKPPVKSSVWETN